ncbi:uncharacterized protein N0V96_001364 [Colletotrichum fioriniae]|uniref:uncharacterized protein n=1 Tax=Colletotrichum fioriniae TaxID=710243 RepID=UPI0032DAB521|nr:hypothetical protein N0V96_001364 [Colletotrichum fioriniae]
MTRLETQQGLEHNDHEPCSVWGNLAGDLAAGTISAILISPAITILDRAVVERTTTGRPLIRGLHAQLRSAIRRPRGFFFARPLGIVWTLYAATYVTANAATTVAERFDGAAAAASTATFASTFLVNVPLGVWKDLRFAEIFGSSSGAAPEVGKAVVAAVPRKLPRAATATFLIRDAVTIFGDPGLCHVFPTCQGDNHAADGSRAVASRGIADSSDCAGLLREAKQAAVF